MGELGSFGEKKQKWFEYDEDTEVCIEQLTKADIRAIQTQTSRLGTRAGEAADKLMGRKAVKGWRKKAEHEHPGFTQFGRPYPYTPENLDALMLGSFEFSKFVAEKAIDEREFSQAESKND